MNNIALERVGKRINQSWMLRDISFEVQSGSVFGIYGRSGSGKSTLLHLISGLDQPTVGVVTLQSSNNNGLWLNAQVSIALQRPGLAPELTVSENLGIFSSLWYAPRKGRTGRVAMIIELLGLSEVRNKQIKRLPEGLKAAAEIARAFISGAEIIAIDGLIERLDRPTRRRVWEYILARKRQGTTFIIGTSSAAEASLCEKIAVLYRGRQVYVGKPDELKNAVQNEVIVVESLHNPLLKSKVGEKFGAAVTERDGHLEFCTKNADADIARVISEFRSDVGCVYLRQPSLDDALDRIEGNS
jgi:ABC-2 type transport system ATP-binding protein